MELNLILGISVIGLLFAVYLIRNVMKRDTGSEQDAGDLRRDQGRSRGVSCDVSIARSFTLRLHSRALIYILYAFVRTPQRHDPAAAVTARALDDALVCPRRCMLGCRWLYGNVGCHPIEHPDCRRRTEGYEQRTAARASRRCSFRVLRRRDEPAWRCRTVRHRPVGRRDQRFPRSRC